MGGGFTQAGTNITVNVPGVHGLNPGDTVDLLFPIGTAVSTNYQIVSVPDPTHFTVTAGSSLNQNVTGLTNYPLVMPPLTRSGNVVIQQSTFSMGYTDTGNTPSLSQSPLRAPTVFNFFFPSYMFPGPLENAGLTTPEFQLTSDTTTILQMNFMESGVLLNTGNTNGISSFISGNGSLVLDLGPWMTAGYTANAGSVSTLVDALNSLLTGGQLSSGAKTAIVNYASSTTNFPISSPPTYTQMRDRVRAVVFAILNAPDFIIQR
jgi:hypothetical protein